MTPDQVFSYSGAFASLGWVILITVGWYKQVATIAGRYIFPGTLALIYLLLVCLHWQGHAGGFGSLADVALLFRNPWLLTAGWVHYLAFDLFVGAWELNDAKRNGIAHGWMIPLLVLTFLLGPIGFLLYLFARQIIRTRKLRSATH